MLPEGKFLLMDTILKVGVLQYNVAWHDIEKNLRKAEILIEQFPDTPDLILLPEMFATGFTMEPELFSGKVYSLIINWMQELSAKYSVAISGSHPFYSGRVYFNRLLFISQEPEINTYYDKRHLFSIGGEDKHYAPGNNRSIIQYRNWRLMPLICYDLRFPVWSRNDLDYDVLFYVTNWPAARNDVWETLLKARAIENQAYVIGVNRIGTDGQNIHYIGNSRVISPKGNILGKLSDEENFLFIRLEKEKLVEFRKKFPVLSDRDHFVIK